MRYRFIQDSGYNWYMIPLSLESEFFNWVDRNNANLNYSEIGPWEGTDFTLYEADPLKFTFKDPAGYDK